MKKIIALTIILIFTAAAVGASEKKELVSMSKKYAKSLLHKNINDSKARDIISFMKFLESSGKSSKSLLSAIKKGKMSKTSFSQNELESYIDKLCDRGDSYAKKGYKHTARLYFQLANYSDLGNEKSSNKLSSLGFSTDSYPLVSELISAAKLEFKKIKTSTKKEERKVPKIDITRMKSKIMSSELQKAKDQKKLEISEEDRVMRGSKSDKGYAERRTERIRASNEKRKEKPGTEKKRHAPWPRYLQRWVGTQQL